MTRFNFALLGTLFLAAPAFAQQPPDSPPGDRGGMQDGRPPQRPPGPGRMLEHLHEELGVSEAQWPDVSAKIETIFQLEHELYAGPGGPGGRPHGGPDGGPNGGPDGGPNGGPDGGPNGGPPGAAGGNGGPDGQPNGAPTDHPAPPPDAPPSDGATTRPAGSAAAEAIRSAKHDLGHLLNGGDATPQEVQTALKTLREARAAAKSQLATAQAELKTMVNDSQQAMLVMAGILE